MQEEDEAAALSLAQHLILTSPEFHYTGIIKFNGEPPSVGGRHNGGSVRFWAEAHSQRRNRYRAYMGGK